MPGLVLAALLPMAVSAQVYELNPCKGGSPGLRADVAADTLPAITQYLRDSVAAEATSHLKADGKAPPKPTPLPDDNMAPDYDARLERWEVEAPAYDMWTCKYAAPRAVDGDLATAWAEGVDGNGEGEILVVRLEGSGPVEIFTGVAKTEALFKKNGRPRRVRVSVYGPPAQGGGFGGGYYFAEMPVLARREAELRDQFGWQELPVPDVAAFEFVAIEIIDVYPGTSWKDTAIAEVRRRP